MTSIFKRIVSLALAVAATTSISITSHAIQVNPTQTQIQSNECMAVDTANTRDGYVQVLYTAKTDNDVRIEIFKDDSWVSGGRLDPEEGWSTIPLTAGNGSYTVIAYESADGTYFYEKARTTFDVFVEDLTANKYVALDAGHAGDGYVRIKPISTNKTFRIDLYKGETMLNVFLHNPGDGWFTLPLTAGDGTYSIIAYERDAAGRHYKRAHFTFSATISDPTAPFLLSSPLVNFDDAPTATATAHALTQNCGTVQEAVNAIHNHIVSTFTYTSGKGRPSFYLPDLDCLLTARTGNCVDQSALMCGMLRSIGIPARMEYGYNASGNYHAWVSVLLEDGWTRYDPSQYVVGYKINPTWTLAYIRNDSNYRTTLTF